MNTLRLRRLSFILFALFVLGAPPLRAQREKLPPDDLEIVEKRWPEAKRTYTGLRYIVLHAGEKGSPSPVPGNIVSLLYKGMFLNGTVFDQATDPSHPLTLRLGRGELIDGWEEAIQNMRKGEKWLLIVPPELGYGTRGKPPTIRGGTTLVFEVELISFSKT